MSKNEKSSSCELTVPYGRRIGRNTAALASGHADVTSGETSSVEMRSVDVERSADADVGRPYRAVPAPQPLPRHADTPRGLVGTPVILDGVARRWAVPAPDTLDWSAAAALVSVDTV